MKRNYFCPQCNVTLNPSTKLILRVTKGTQNGLVLFSPQPGNYNAIWSPELRLSQGERVSLFCPVCQADLRFETDDRFARIGFNTASGMTGQVLFSRTLGEHATYFVTKETIRSYGEAASQSISLNFFGERRDLG
jgi:RNase P subunit RPR2